MLCFVCALLLFETDNDSKSPNVRFYCGLKQLHLFHILQYE
jgi:hypothetical protein